MLFFVAIISFILSSTSQSIVSELNNTLELHNDSNIFNILIQLTFLCFISLFYTTGTAKLKSKSLVDNFQLSQGLIKHLETKNNKDKIELIKKHRVQILTKFPELRTNPLFKIKSDKLLIIEEE
jgi:hypothetical protein